MSWDLVKQQIQKYMKKMVFMNRRKEGFRKALITWTFWFKCFLVKFLHWFWSLSRLVLIKHYITTTFYNSYSEWLFFFFFFKINFYNFIEKSRRKRVEEALAKGFFPFSENITKIAYNFGYDKSYQIFYTFRRFCTSFLKYFKFFQERLFISKFPLITLNNSSLNFSKDPHKGFRNADDLIFQLIQKWLLLALFL